MQEVNAIVVEKNLYNNFSIEPIKYVVLLILNVIVILIIVIVVDISIIGLLANHKLLEDLVLDLMVSFNETSKMRSYRKINLIL